MIDKMKASILGFAVGDALGVPAEFLNRTSLQKNPIKEMVGYGTHNVPSGTWSDDTSLMIATIDSIIENNNINFDDIMYKFTEWFNYAKYTATDELFDIGISTRKALLNFNRGVSATNCGPNKIYENGNGSLMRILPIVYYLKFSDFIEEEKPILIKQASSLTHAHEISCLGCQIYNDYLNMLLNGIDKFQAIEMLKKNNYNRYYSDETVKQYDRILKGDIVNVNIDDIKSSGYVVHSLEASIWCTLNNNSFEEAVLTAVNLGEDTDTIGAITGSINGVIYGKNSIPEKWLNKLKRKDYIEEISDKFINIITCNKNNKIR